MAREYVMFRIQKENVRRRRCDQSSERKMAREDVMIRVQKEKTIKTGR